MKRLFNSLGNESSSLFHFVHTDIHWSHWVIALSFILLIFSMRLFLFVLVIQRPGFKRGHLDVSTG